MSKRRLRRRSCTSKVRHATEQAAKHAAWKLQRQGYSGRAYKCPFCQGWHVGRMNRRQRQGMKARRGW